VVGPIADLSVQPGDLISVLIGPRDGNHSCDLTAVDLSLTGEGGSWDLAREVSPDILAGNPHADAQGHKDIWHFYTEPDQAGAGESVIPPGSTLARWRSATSAEERSNRAVVLQDLLTADSRRRKTAPTACSIASLPRCAGRS